MDHDHTWSYFPDIIVVDTMLVFVKMGVVYQPCIMAELY